MSKKFYLTWLESDMYPSPAKHKEKEKAIKEASFLCEKHKIKCFVFEVVGVASPVEVPTNYKDI